MQIVLFNFHYIVKLNVQIEYEFIIQWISRIDNLPLLQVQQRQQDASYLLWFYTVAWNSTGSGAAFTE